MLKNITTLKIQGANFNMPTSITLFDPTDGGKVRSVKAALLYGRSARENILTACFVRF